MYIAMNRFKVMKGAESAFEHVWLSRDTHLDRVPGFLELSPLAMFEGATVTVFDGRCGECAAWPRAGRACGRARGGQDVAWKVASTWSDVIS